MQIMFAVNFGKYHPCSRIWKLDVLFTCRGKECDGLIHPTTLSSDMSLTLGAKGGEVRSRHVALVGDERGERGCTDERGGGGEARAGWNSAINDDLEGRVTL